MPGKPGTATIVQAAIAVNKQSGEFDYLLAAATCDYFDGAVVNLLNGQYIVTNPNLTISDNADQTVGVVPSLVNVNASNGVVHVIDKVLLPWPVIAARKRDGDAPPGGRLRPARRCSQKSGQ